MIGIENVNDKNRKSPPAVNYATKVDIIIGYSTIN